MADNKLTDLLTQIKASFSTKKKKKKGPGIKDPLSYLTNKKTKTAALDAASGVTLSKPKIIKGS